MNTDREARAKQPRSVMAGPYGHPLHPAVVTIPIGAWLSSVVLDIAALTTDNPALAEASVWVIGIGIVGAVLAAILGATDLSRVPKGTRAFKTGATHATLNTVGLVLFAISFWIRLGADTNTVPISAFVLSIVAIILVGASGWLGGKLAYTYGIRVADEQTQERGFS